MAWVALVAAGLFETAFAVCLKLSDGLRDPWPTAGFAAAALASFGLLTVALRDLPVGPAYAAWTGIGAAGAATGVQGRSVPGGDEMETPPGHLHLGSKPRTSRFPGYAPLLKG